MANVNITPNMQLTVPITGLAPGPEWANDYNNCMNLIDSHNHSPGFGTPISSSGININSDLSWNNSNNAINLRSIRFTAQGSPLSLGADLGCLYESGVDLYYNDGNGNQIRITQSGSVSGSAGTITGLPSGTASAAYQSGSGTFQFLQATSTAANIDVGSIVVRYPGSYPSPSGNYILLEAPSSLSSQYTLTLPLPTANTSFVTMTSGGQMFSSLYPDNVTIGASGNALEVLPGGISSTQLASSAVTTAKIANSAVTYAKTGSANFVQSSSSSNLQDTPTSFTTILSTSSIITNGNPVLISIVSDENGTNDGFLGWDFGNGVGSEYGELRLLRNASTVGIYRFGNPTGLGEDLAPTAIPLGISWIDSAPATSITYHLQWKVSVSGGFVFLYYAKLIAYELR